MDVEYKLANAFADKPTSQRAFEDMSALSTVTDASANACTRLCAFTDTFSSAHLCCADCAYDRFLITLPASGEWRERRREQMAVTPVPRTSSGPMRHMWLLKLDVCMTSASSNSYKGL